MEDLDPLFVKKVRPGDIITAGKNFGCGSSREHAPLAIKASGISCVIASSFARIFFRNAVNIGLPIMECCEAAQDADEGDVLDIDLAEGLIKNRTKGKTYQAAPVPDFIQEIIKTGGLIMAVRNQLRRNP
jgi:3-isopropylmalate/(R)-2-methylmalate dehydratase small subunit